MKGEKKENEQEKSIVLPINIHYGIIRIITS